MAEMAILVFFQHDSAKIRISMSIKEHAFDTDKKLDHRHIPRI